MQHGIVIPCYNESSRLDLKSFIGFAKTHKGATLCFVNDGSSDRTRATLAKIKNLVHDNVHIFNVSTNAGKANAVRQGSLYLFSETEVDTIGFLDADLSTSFSEYNELVNVMSNKNPIQIVFGSRNMGEGDAQIERNPIRKLLSETIRFLIFLITRLKIKDTQCGAKVFHRSLVPLIYRQGFFSKWLFDVEILLRLKEEIGLAKFKKIFVEKPLAQWIHMDGSKLSLRDSIMIPMNLLDIWFNYEVRPMVERWRSTSKLFIQTFSNKWFHFINK